MQDIQIISLVNTALWTKWLAIGTFIMAGASLFTIIFTLITLKHSQKKKKYDIASQLFMEFVELHAQFFEKITDREYASQADMRNISPIYNRQLYRLVLFLSKLGKFLSKSIITREEIQIFFWSYLGYKYGLIRLFKNLYLLQNWLLKEVKDDLEYLLKEISVLSNDSEFTTLLTNFTIKNKN